MIIEGIKVTAGAYPFILLFMFGIAMGAVSILFMFTNVQIDVTKRKQQRKETRARMHKERAEVRAIEAAEHSEELMQQRAELRPAIQTWLAQTMGRKGRKITSWEFARGSADHLLVGFEGMQEPVKGQIYFTQLGGEIRITRFSWNEKGEDKFISGLILPKQSSETWRRYFVSELTAPEHIAFFNQVAEKIISGKSGTGVIKITKMFGITLDTYQTEWDKEKVEGLAKAIGETFDVKKIDFEKGILVVSLKEL